jgi:murein DD-endopeptidase MepM/ murein hydrolase activator NlpD
MPSLHRESRAGTAGRLGLAVLLLAAGVILTLGPGSAALAERAAGASQAGSPARAPTLRPPAWAEAVDPEPTGPEPVPPLRMPLAGPLVRGFDASAGSYGPGHRGVDIGGQVQERVRAPAGGRVEFAGPVAGVTWVSLLVAPGVMVTVGPLLDVQVAEGQRVRALDPVGRLGPGHGMALHLSLRIDGIYVDPLPYLLDRPRPRLAPLLSPGGLAGPDPPGPPPAAPDADPRGP